MNQTFFGLLKNLTHGFPFSVSRRNAKTDHRKLTRQILKISRQQTSKEMIGQVAECLKEYLNYKLFAFVIQKRQDIDVWLDPAHSKKTFEPILSADFAIPESSRICYLNGLESDHTRPNIDPENLVFYDMSIEKFKFRIYLLTNQNDNTAQDEIVHLVFQGCAIALSQQLKIEHLQDAAVIDPLTGCYNRREFESQLRRNIAGAVRHHTSMSVFMFDLDHFKQINDTYGHPAGDKVLQTIAGLVKDNMRTNDILFRYGGEEFIAVLPETDKHKAMELADRLREKIAAYAISHQGTMIRVTASFGVAQLNPMADMDRIIQDADTMLYRAKKNGRNTVMPGLIKVMPEKAPSTRVEHTL